MKFKRILTLGLALVMAIGTVGCQPSTPVDKPTQTVLAETHGPLSEKILADIKTQPEIGTLAKTLKDGLADAQPEDADSAVLLYVKYADSMASKLAGKLIYTTAEFSEKFNTVFSQEFNQTWNEEKIDSISDPDVKAIFVSLSDALYKVDSYGQYFGPVVNYQKVSELPGISKELRKYYQSIASLYSLSRLANQIQGLDYASTAEYAAAIEDSYNQTSDLTLKESSATVLRFALNLYYTGTEGSSPFDFDNNTLKAGFVEATKEVIKKYPNYHIAKLGKQFLDTFEANDQRLSTDFADIVINYKRFGFDSDLSITTNKTIKENDYYEIIPVVGGFKDKAISEKIASTIEATVGKIKENVAWEKTEKTNYHLSYLVDFANEKYLSLQLSGVSYNQENSKNLYDNQCLLFDVKTGEAITLKDIFKADYEANIAKIKELVKKDIVENQQLNYKTSKDIVIEDNVLLDQNYMMVILKKGSYSDEQPYDIVSYINYSDLLSTFDMNAYLR